jgi:hypothetical protein
VTEIEIEPVARRRISSDGVGALLLARTLQWQGFETKTVPRKAIEPTIYDMFLALLRNARVGLGRRSIDEAEDLFFYYWRWRQACEKSPDLQREIIPSEVVHFIDKV